MFFTFSKLYKWYQIAQRITNKAHGYDKISIRTLKICGDLICKPWTLYG